MFSYQIPPRTRKREFGQFTAFLPLISSVISVGGGIAQSLIASSTAKEIASTQQATQIGMATVQERIAQLQLQAFQTQAQTKAAQAAQATPAPSPGVTGAISSVVSSSVAGIPTWMILAIGAGAFLLLRK
jgi:hypothetical protein